MATKITSAHHAGNSSLEFKVEDGTKKMTILPNDLNIIWGDDKRYWNVPDDGSPAELNQVCWLEVKGCVAKTSPEKTYEVGFEVSLAPSAFGWGNSPLFVMVKRGKHGRFKWTKYRMMQDDDDGTTDPTVPRIITGKLSPDDDDKENINDSSSDHDKLYFGIYEVWTGKWKGGLKIHHAFVEEIMPSATATTTTSTST